MSKFNPNDIKIDCQYIGPRKQWNGSPEKIPVWFGVIGNKLAICWDEDTLEQIIIDKDIAKVLLERIK